MGLIDCRFREEEYRLAAEGKRGEELFYSYDGLLQLLNLCETYGVVVWGIEGFNKIGSLIEQNGNVIADFSSLSHLQYEDLVGRNFLEIRKFLDSVDSPEELLWSVVIEDS